MRLRVLIVSSTVVGAVAVHAPDIRADDASPPDGSDPVTLGEQGYLQPSFEWHTDRIRVTIGDEFMDEPVASLTCNGVTTEADGTATISVELTDHIDTLDVECSIPGGVRFGLALPGIERNGASFIPNDAAYEAFSQCVVTTPIFPDLTSRIWPVSDSIRFECPVDVGDAWFEPADALVRLLLAIHSCIPTWDNTDCPAPPAPSASEPTD